MKKVYILLCFISVFTYLEAKSCWDEQENLNKALSELSSNMILSFKDDKNCSPIQNAKVNFFGKVFLTNANGEIRIPVPDFSIDTTTKLLSEKENYIPFSKNVKIHVGTISNVRFLMSQHIPLEQIPTIYSRKLELNIKDKVSSKDKINNYIENDDLISLKKYTEKYPDSVKFIKNNKLKLLLTGPKGLKIGDIKQYVKNSNSEAKIIQKIKKAKKVYGKFSPAEISELSKMKLGENILSTIIGIPVKRLKSRIKKRLENKKLEIIEKYSLKKDTLNKESLIKRVKDKVKERLLDRLFPNKEMKD